MEIEEDKHNSQDAYQDSDIDKYTIDANILQVARLNTLLSSTNFRLQTEDFARSKLQKYMKDVSKQTTSKARPNESASSMMSDDASSVKKSTTKNKKLIEKTTENMGISDEMKLCLESLEKARLETKTKLRNIYDEIDFESLKESVKKRQLNNRSEFESQAKQIFRIVQKKYETSPAIPKILNNILSICTGKSQTAEQSKQVQSKLPSLASTGAMTTSEGHNRPEMTYSMSSAVNPSAQVTNNNTNASAVPDNKTEEYTQLSKEEKKELGKKIKRLNQKHMKGIVKIVKGDGSVNSGPLVFNLNNLSAAINRQLEKYVNNCLESDSANNNMTSSDTNNQSTSQGVKGSQY